MKDYPDLFAGSESGSEEGPATRVLFLDTETTGPDPATADVCEIGAVLASYSGFARTAQPLQEYLSLIRPGEAIPPEASAVHHITNAMVRDAPTVRQIEPALRSLVESADCLCAHNAPFDFLILGRLLPNTFRPMLEPRILDSLRLARHIWPDVPSHALQALRYRFDLGAENSGDPHRALFDAHLARELVEFVISSGRTGCADWAGLVEYARSPLEVSTFTFGKYRGSLVEDIVAQDADYVRWLLQQKWVPADYPDLYSTLLRKLGPEGGRGK
jgi:exodeoxyribonuclease X